MAVSQMEPTDARRAFPCFDEPNMKAVFAVTLGRHRDMTALSNMPLVNTTAMQVIFKSIGSLNRSVMNKSFSIQGRSERLFLGPICSVSSNVNLPGGFHCG